MILAIGIVVDMPIVVVEAVHAKMEKVLRTQKCHKSAMSGFLSHLSINIGNVFARIYSVSFISGSSGFSYANKFGITLAIAILIFSSNALTFEVAPALAALFLKTDNPSERT